VRFPWDSYEPRNMCVRGEVIIMTSLIRDYKKEKKAEGWGWEKNLGSER